MRGADVNVLKVGAWLSDVLYFAPEDGNGEGELFYNVNAVLEDDGDPSYTFRHNIHVLGFNWGAADGGTDGVE